MEVIISKRETYIVLINFYSGQETLVQVGADDYHVDSLGRKKTFEIASDERLIGAELAYCVDDARVNSRGMTKKRKEFFAGVTWIKMKVNV